MFGWRHLAAARIDGFSRLGSCRLAWGVEDSEQGVDEGGNRGSFRNEKQAAQQRHDEDDRGKPVLFPLSHVAPQVCQKLKNQKGFSKFSRVVLRSGFL